MSTTANTDSALAREWDELRGAFASSIMIDTALSSLAQNLDGVDWPIVGPAETPAAYIDLTFPELTRSVAARGQPQAAALLVQILRETLSFDQPFGEMVKQSQAAADRENPLLRSLQRLGIPENFPLELTVLDETSRHLCRLEQAWTIGEFALLAQRLSQSVIVGGDLKRLLNALVETDEQTLAQLLPFRVGVKGLHLAEALGQATRKGDPADHATRAIAWFDPEFGEWLAGEAASRRFARRQLAVLNDELVERQALELLTPHLKPAVAPASSGFRAALKRWFHL